MAANYGFRPKKSYEMAVKTLKLKGMFTTISIEGDIKGAYTNINRGKLLYLISFRIKDKQFMEVLKSRSDTGIMERQRYIHTLTATLQGGIVSPLLFNIYMFSLGKFIFKDIQHRTRNNTGKRNKHNLDYSKIQEAMIRQDIAILEIKSKEKMKLLINSKSTCNKLFETPSIDLKQKNVGAIHARYAVDWCISSKFKEAPKMLLK